MFQQFFGFTALPFAKDIDPAKLFMTDMVKEALN
jgi:hypothetical protein